jgi:hypothetical protein
MAGFRVRWEIVCSGCRHRQRHVVPLAERRTATFECPNCGPLNLSSRAATPNGRNKREQFYRSYTDDEHGRGIWMCITGNPAEPR